MRFNYSISDKHMIYKHDVYIEIFDWSIMLQWNPLKEDRNYYALKLYKMKR